MFCAQLDSNYDLIETFGIWAVNSDLPFILWSKQTSQQITNTLILVEAFQATSSPRGAETTEHLVQH